MNFRFLKICRISILSGLLFLTSNGVWAQLVQSDNNLSCATSCAESNCIELSRTGNPAETRLILLAVILFMLAVFFGRKYKNKLFIAGGSVVSLLLVSLLFFNPFAQTVSSQVPQVIVSPVIGVVEKAASSEEFKTPDNDFEAVGNSEFSETVASNKISETSVPSQSADFKDAGDEFTSAGDEFASPSAEFSANEPIKSPDPATTGSPGKSDEPKANDYSLLYQLAVLFSLLIGISYLIKYENFRKTRGLFLIVSVGYLGFYKGACPCMILSFQNTILAILGQPIEWISMVWFLGLIPLTYFFGKVWCGWLCHLGGLQDFLYQSPKLNVLKTNKSQSILRYFRIGLLVVLVIQLIITKTNLYIHYDPFKVAFNLFSANKTGSVLLILLLATSVLIYRPFCRAVCPVGLILGWISLIPGSRRLAKNDTCVDCNSCAKPCRTKAMIYEHKKSILNVQDCVLCGDCLGHCKKNSLYIVNFKK